MMRSLARCTSSIVAKQDAPFFPQTRGSHSPGDIISGLTTRPAQKPSNSGKSMPPASSGIASSRASSSLISVSVSMVHSPLSPVLPWHHEVQHMHLVLVRMIFIEEGIAIKRKYPGLPFEARAAFRRIGQGSHPTLLDRFQKIQHRWDFAGVYIINQAQDRRIHLWGDDNRRVLHRVWLRKCETTRARGAPGNSCRLQQPPARSQSPPGWPQAAG